MEKIVKGQNFVFFFNIILQSSFFYHRPRDFIHSVNLQFTEQPTTEKMEGLRIAAHGFFTQLCAAAIKHKFIGKPLKIQIFHTKNTPVHWGKIHPIKQEYSLVQRKKFIGMKNRF